MPLRGRSRSVLSDALALQVKQMYQQVKENGRKRYSHMEIAKMLGVSETTVFRAIKSFGAYTGVPEPISETEMQLRAEASQRRFLLEMGLVQPPAVPEVAEETRELTVLDRMQEDLARKRAADPTGNQMLEELKGEKND